jgi:hypothetical protein
VGCVHWFRLAQDRDWWWAVMSAVMNLQVLAPRSWLVSYIQVIEGFTGSAVFLRQTSILPLMYLHHFDYKPFRQFM